MSTPVSGNQQLLSSAAAVQSKTSEDTELALLEWQLQSTPSTHQYLGSGRFGLSKGHNAAKGGNVFTTFPRKRQFHRPLMTVWWDRGLLDEGQVQQTQLLLSGITRRWDFNAFHLDRLTGGHNLPSLCIHLFQDCDLIRHYHLDPLVVWKFFALVEKSYHATNPYHNAVHAADVTQAMSRFLAEPALRAHLEPVEILGSIIAAVCHDLDHPGLNEKFLIATSSHLTGLYNNTSVLENHHWSMAVALMHESGLSSSLSRLQHQELVDIIRSLILATDISRQQEFLTQLRYLLDKEELNLSQARCRHFILQIALKCADISNPCRSWQISRLWSYRACEEFFRQGDREREMNLQVTPFCDRLNISVAKVQSTFYRYVASPLFEEWHRFLGSPLSTIMTKNLTSNQARWDLLVQQEGPAGMAESVISQTSTSSSSGAGSIHCDSRLEAPRASHQRRSSAEDEDSDPCTSYPYLPLDENSDSVMSRRHSLPFSITYYDEDMFLLGSHLHRQFSLGERRTRQAELLATTAQYRAAHRRRVFASRVVPQSTVYDSPSFGCSLNSSLEGSDPPTESCESHRVTFQIGSGSSPSLCNSRQDSQEPVAGVRTCSSFNKNLRPCHKRFSFEYGDSKLSPDVQRFMHNDKEVTQRFLRVDKENLAANLNDLGRRRGSAPSHLLLNQINRAAGKLASSAAAVAESVYVDTSANSKCRQITSSVSSSMHALDLSHRRGSLPSNLVHANLSCCQTLWSSQRCSCTTSTTTPSFDNRWQHLNNHNNNNNNNNNSGLTQMHSGDLLCDKQQCNHHKQQPQQKRPLRRGSFRSSSFGGVGNRRGSAPMDTPLSQRSGCESLPKEWLKKYNANTLSGKKRANIKNGLYLNSEDILHDIRTFSNVQLIKSGSKISPGNQFVAKQSSYNANGRRGSLPVEYIATSYIR